MSKIKNLTTYRNILNKKGKDIFPGMPRPKGRVYRDMPKPTGEVYDGFYSNNVSGYIEDVKQIIENKKDYEKYIKKYQDESKKIKDLKNESSQINNLLVAKEEYLNDLESSFINRMFKVSYIEKTQCDINELKQLLDEIEKSIEEICKEVFKIVSFQTVIYERLLNSFKELNYYIERLTQKEVEQLIKELNIEVVPSRTNKQYYNKFEESKKQLRAWFYKINPDLLNKPMNMNEDLDVQDQIKKIKTI